MKTKYSRMKRLVTERDAKKIRRHGKLMGSFIATRIGMKAYRYRYKNATYLEWIRE
jgi:hypothetical protein